jgi:hypothetical protein
VEGNGVSFIPGLDAKTHLAVGGKGPNAHPNDTMGVETDHILAGSLRTRHVGGILSIPIAAAIWYIQCVSATPVNSLNTWYGVFQPNRFLGLLFRRYSTYRISSSVIVLKSVFLEKNLLIRPLRFSFDPRSHELYAWAK